MTFGVEMVKKSALIYSYSCRRYYNRSGYLDYKKGGETNGRIGLEVSAMMPWER